jgi:hypothetical protein
METTEVAGPPVIGSGVGILVSFFFIYRFKTPMEIVISTEGEILLCLGKQSCC